MDLTSVRVIKNLLKKYQTAPLKRLGQNFLIDKSVLKKIIESANLKADDVVLEIGPGIGTLTQELAKRVKKVIAIERDQKMCQILKKMLDYWNVGNVEIVQGDVLQIKNLKLKIKNYKLVANLPYYIISPVIRKFLENKFSPKEMILMVQKEVAQRICAKPPEMSLLAISVQLYAKSEILFYVPKNSFWPQPKVDGAILKITPLTDTNRKLINTKLFFKIVKAGFSQPRKQLCNSLANGLKLTKEQVKEWLLKNGVEPSQRAETLSVEDWIKLTKDFRKT